METLKALSAFLPAIFANRISHSPTRQIHSRFFFHARSSEAAVMSQNYQVETSAFEIFIISEIGFLVYSLA